MSMVHIYIYIHIYDSILLCSIHVSLSLYIYIYIHTHIYTHNIMVATVYRFLQKLAAPGAVCDLRIEQDGAYGAFCQVFSSLEVGWPGRMAVP